MKSFAQFLSDCQTGSLPSVSIVSPGISSYTEENPNDVQLGEAYSSSIINAVMHGPAWPKTVLLFMYDEHGGYYDHVAPPTAVPPDDIAPAVAPTPDAPAAWDHYGLRVPAFVISPFAKPRFVSHKVHDHTSVLRFIETKFNLGALTRRDARATNLLDCFDFRLPGVPRATGPRRARSSGYGQHVHPRDPTAPHLAPRRRTCQRSRHHGAARRSAAQRLPERPLRAARPHPGPGPLVTRRCDGRRELVQQIVDGSARVPGRDGRRATSPSCRRGASDVTAA